MANMSAVQTKTALSPESLSECKGAAGGGQSVAAVVAARRLVDNKREEVGDSGIIFERPSMGSSGQSARSRQEGSTRTAYRSSLLPSQQLARLLRQQQSQFPDSSAVTATGLASAFQARDLERALRTQLRQRETLQQAPDLTARMMLEASSNNTSRANLRGLAPLEHLLVSTPSSHQALSATRLLSLQLNNPRSEAAAADLSAFSSSRPGSSSTTGHHQLVNSYSDAALVQSLLAQSSSQRPTTGVSALGSTLPLSSSFSGSSSGTDTRTTQQLLLATQEPLLESLLHGAAGSKARSTSVGAASTLIAAPEPPREFPSPLAAQAGSSESNRSDTQRQLLRLYMLEQERQLRRQQAQQGAARGSSLR